ncbi:MAG: hypothetical protein AB8B85_10600 [Paracoccaceae bacterium]
MQIKSFCTSDFQLECWAKMFEYDFFPTIQSLSFKKLLDDVEDYNSVCVFANSRFAIHAIYFNEFIPDDVQSHYVLINPVLNPFALDEFKFLKDRKGHSGYSDMFQFDSNDSLILSTNERDDRVDEKFALKLAHDNADITKIFINVDKSGHSAFISDDMVRAISTTCGQR